MGSPLGPALANIFEGFYEKQLLESISNKPLLYFRYVDDTLAIFNNESECDLFLNRLNGMHKSLKFTYEKESNNCLPFLDVLVERHDSRFSTTVYRKPTFTGQYTRWDSFCPKKRKINLISTLTHRAISICSSDKLEDELTKIRSILIANGYPPLVINSTIKQKVFAIATHHVSAHNNPAYLMPCLPKTTLDWKYFLEI